MELQRLIKHFTYHIEPKPGGGFVARADDTSLPPLEAATRWELQEKIQQNISTALAAEFPGLKLPIKQKELKVTFHIERRSDGGFTIHSSDPNAPPTAAASHEIESKFAEKLIGFMGKHLASKLPPELAAQVASGDIKVFVNRKVVPGTGALTPNGTQMLTTLMEGDKPGTATYGNTNALGATGGTISYSGDDSPIKPGNDTSWKFLRFLLTLLIIGAMLYFYLRYAH
jgi:hypothetical protein